MMVIHVLGSWLRKTLWIGLAQRYFGRSEPWTLIGPKGGISRRIWGISFPYAITTKKSGFFSWSRSKKFFHSIDFSGFILFGVWISSTGIPNSRAWDLIIFGCSFSPLPTGLSGWVTTPTTSNLGSWISSCIKGTPIGAEEKKTTL